jgi:hypothetical protein
MLGSIWACERGDLVRETVCSCRARRPTGTFMQLYKNSRHPTGASCSADQSGAPDMISLSTQLLLQVWIFMHMHMWFQFAPRFSAPAVEYGERRIGRNEYALLSRTPVAV